MAFDPSRLYQQLLNTGLQNKDNPLYQVMREIISALSKLTSLTGASGTSGSSSPGGLANQSYITANNDTGLLPNSRQAIAGTNISLNTSIPGQIIINSIGASNQGYWTPLTDGDVDETDLIFANGESIAVFVPTP